MTLNLDNPNVVELDMPVEDVRKLIDLELPDDLTTAIDEAQGIVFSGQAPVAYLVIKITK